MSMSYLQWDGHYQSLLDGWVATVSAKLVAERRYEDMMSLMSCLNSFESLASINAMYMSSDEAWSWLQLKISDLACALSDLSWNGHFTNDDVYGVLQDIFEFVQINDLSNALISFGKPQKLLLPKSRLARIKFNF